MTVAAFLLSKVVVATAIAALAEVVRRRASRPEPAYAMWATVLAVLVIPSIMAVRVPSWVDVAADSISTNLFSNASLRVAIAFWAVGGGAILWRQWRSLRWLERLVRFAAAAPPNLFRRCAAISAELGVRDCPTVVTASGTFSPFLWHPIFGEPRVVIPSELLFQLSEEAIDTVLRHELVHMRRRDAWRRRFEVMVLALWWWLPTTWIARARLRELEELCTDAAVVRTNPNGAKAYARALLDTEEFLSRSKPRDLLVVPAFARRGSLNARITRIVTDESNATRSSQVVVCCAVGILLSLGLLTPGVAPRTFTAESPATQPPTDDSRGTLNFPELESVTVQNSDHEIVLTWPSDDPSMDDHTIRLVRVSDDGVEPRLWRIVTSLDYTAEDKT